MRFPLPNRARAFLAFLSVLSINAALIFGLVTLSNDMWWAFAPVLALGAASVTFYATMLGLNAIFWHRAKLSPPLEPLLVLVTAYRESGPELEATLASVLAQDLDPRVERSILVVVDGDFETAAYARTLDAESVEYVADAYEDWIGRKRSVELRKTTREGTEIVFAIKSAHSGKRDSVVLARTLAHARLQANPMTCDHALAVSDALKSAWGRFVPIAARRIAGVDADTILAPECIAAMLEEANAPGPRPVDGVVGVIRADPSKARDFREKCYIAFQEVGYCVGQVLMRAYQSRITEKVSCLSGACYVVYVPTMCAPALLKEFNAPPAEDAGVFESILSFASEDRRAVVLALSSDKGVRFKQALDPRAIAWTVPPTNLAAFLSQRRRWSLGTLCNNLHLVLFGHKLLLIERLVAFVTIVGWLCSPLYLAANVLLLYTVITNFDIQLVYVSTPMMFVWGVTLAIPLVSNYFVGWKDRLAFYPKYALYFIFGPFVSILIQWNSLLNAHSISWGKTCLPTK